MNSCVLIDDDELIHFLWLEWAKMENVSLHIYNSPSDFAARKDILSEETPIFLDVSFADDVLGGIRSVSEIASQGFRNIYLATGHRHEDLDLAATQGMILGVRDKGPPEVWPLLENQVAGVAKEKAPCS